MAAPRSLVLGTAGHIDHGKTSLVRALTGQETDRLPEEKRRGITIDLGFAPWKINKNLEASIVDVPGHEAFVRTMVAGAGGLDAVVLVISAEDGVMPQTREHLAVCRLLDIKQGLVALTKVDCLEDDEDAITLAIDDVRESLAGSRFESAEIIPCSAHTGQGIDALRTAITRMAKQAARPSHKCPPILPIDRVFTLKGHGTVVTGTLLEGEINLERQEHLSLMPVGNRREQTQVRGRGLHVRNHSTHRSIAGTRTSVNLGGMPVDEIHRGDVLSHGPRVVCVSEFHAELEQLEHSDRVWARGTTLQLCAGTAHAVATLDPLAAFDADGTPRPDQTIPPGGRGLVRVRLDEALPIWQGLRLILRAFSDPAAERHGLTLGGGRVLDPRPTTGRGQRPRWLQLLKVLAEANPRKSMTAIIDDAGLQAVEIDELAIRCGEPDPSRHLNEMLASDTQVLRVGEHTFVGRHHVDDLQKHTVATVDAYHKTHPLQPGLGRAHLISGFPARCNPLVAELVIQRAVAAGQLRVADDKGSLARPGKGQLVPGQLPSEMQQVLDCYQREDSTTPTLKDLQQQCNMEAKQVLEIVSLLHRSKLLVRITDELSYEPRVHAQIVEKARQHLIEHGSIDVQALKEITGLSRKFVVPFLEHLDRQHVTVRRGDQRLPGPACRPS